MKYYNIKPIAAKGCEYNIIYGGRASGKSYQMAEYLLDDYIDNGAQFVRLIRSWGQGKGLDTYFQELIDNNPKKYDGIKVEMNQDKGFRYTCNGEPFGYIIPLSLQHNYKSSQYPEVVNVLFEEFVAPSAFDYLNGSGDDELRAFRSALSTIFRHRGGRVWLIGNSEETSNPYFEFFGIDGSQLKVGDLKKFTRMITLKGKSVPAASVAVEYVPIGYTDPNEVPIMMRIPDNEIAITGAIEESKNITDKISRVYNESGFMIGLTVDGVDPYNNPLFVWTGDSGSKYYAVQTYAGVIYIAEDSAATGADIRLKYGDETPDMFSCWNARIVKSPNYVEETGAAATSVCFNSSATEYHYSTDVNKWTENDRLLKRLGLCGGADTTTARGQEEQRKLAYSRRGYVMNDLIGKR